MSATPAQTATDLDAELAALHEHLTRELERQFSIRDFCRGQRAAAIEGDAARLEAQTESLVALVAQAQTAERERLRMVAKLVDLLQLSREEQTLTGLIRAVPASWRPVLEELQAGFRELLADTRRITRTNRRFFARSARSLDDALCAAFGVAPESPNYTEQGQTEAGASTTPAMLNAAG